MEERPFRGMRYLARQHGFQALGPHHWLPYSVTVMYDPKLLFILSDNCGRGCDHGRARRGLPCFRICVHR
jgi:hypothetical protein